MITVKFSSNFINRKIVMKEVTDTPATVFEELGTDPVGSMVSINGNVLSNADLGKTFEENGVADGEEIYLRAVVKADGAAE